MKNLGVIFSLRENLGKFANILKVSLQGISFCIFNIQLLFLNSFHFSISNISSLIFLVTIDAFWTYSNQQYYQNNQMIALRQYLEYPHHMQSAATQNTAFMLIMIAAGICLILFGCCITLSCIYYQKYKTKLLYNQTPENFSKKPQHGLSHSKYNFKQITLKTYTQEQLIGHNVNIQIKKLLQGPVHEIQFALIKSIVQYDKVLSGKCYFQVEILKDASLIQIGFVHSQDKYKLADGIDLSRIGVSFNNYGQVMCLGQRVYSFPLNPIYGDTLGIGITQQKQDSKKRVWLSFNGRFLNPPTPGQIEEWIAKQSFDQQAKIQYQKDKKLKAEQEQQEQKQQNTLQKDLARKRIFLPSAKTFSYYAIISSSQNKGGKSKVNVNVGGQIFRMHNSQLLTGLLA